MTAKELSDRIGEMCSHVLFDYNGKACGVDPIEPSRFDLWCGEQSTVATSLDEVMTLNFFDGKSLSEIVDDIENLEQ